MVCFLLLEWCNTTSFYRRFANHFSSILDHKFTIGEIIILHRLILHIGSPKMGTTAIQQFLYENQDFLEKKIFLPMDPGKKVFLFYRKKASGIQNSDAMFTSEQRHTYLKQFEKENAEIPRRYLGREYGILFYDQQPIPICELDDSALCDDIKDRYCRKTSLKSSALSSSKSTCPFL